MNATLLAVFLSGVMASPSMLMGEKAYIREVMPHTIITPTQIEINLEDEDFQSMKPGILFDFEQGFGSKAPYLLDWLESEHQKPIEGEKDRVMIELTLECREILLEKSLGRMTLIYERSYG